MFIYMAGSSFINLSGRSLQQAGEGSSGWAWVIIFLLITLVVALALIWQARQVQPLVLPHVEHGSAHAEKSAATLEVAPEPAAPAAPDDLILIEGIGPKINQLLLQAGITSFAQLAATPVETLQKLMLDANLRIANPATWPEQAGLAAEGKWEELQKLQDSLKAGRRV